MTQLTTNHTDALSEDPVVVFALEGQLCGLPLDSVERVEAMCAITPLPSAPSVVAGVINVHGSIVPVLDLARPLTQRGRQYRLGDQLLLVRTPTRSVAIAADQVVGVHALPIGGIASPGTVWSGIRRISGIATFNGDLLYIYDLDQFLSSQEEEQLAAALQEHAA